MPVEFIAIMADLATPSGAAMFDAGGASEKKNTITKPEKPDEETYKANLKKAEKEHADVMAKLVSPFELSHCLHSPGVCRYIANYYCRMPSGPRLTLRSPRPKIHHPASAAES